MPAPGGNYHGSQRKSDRRHPGRSVRSTPSIFRAYLVRTTIANTSCPGLRTKSLTDRRMVSFACERFQILRPSPVQLTVFSGERTSTCGVAGAQRQREASAILRLGGAPGSVFRAVHRKIPRVTALAPVHGLTRSWERTTQPRPSSGAFEMIRRASVNASAMHPSTRIALPP